MAFTLDGNQQVLDQMQQAFEQGNEAEAGKLFVQFAQGIQDEVMAEAKQSVEGLRNSFDMTVLSNRGVRQLTSEEREFYQEVIDAMKSPDPKQAITNLDKAIPRTVIDDVMSELESEHPLLDAIDFQNTSGITEWIINKGTKQLAQWGKLCDEIIKELEGDIAVVNLTMSKLSAWIPVCKAMLELGPEWLDRYVRALLREATAYGLEQAIVTGTGVDMPIGMDRDLEGARSDGQPYVKKVAVAVTDFSPAVYGGLVGQLATDRNGRGRKVNGLILVVNPIDYFTKVVPATTFFLPGAGMYANNIFPIPTQVIQSEEVAVGSAILGIGKRYFMGAGIDKQGKIEFSDEFRFLEDQRVYKTRFLGSGFPKDNTSFIVLDISGLEPLVQTVKTITPEPTPAP